LKVLIDVRMTLGGAALIRGRAARTGSRGGDLPRQRHPRPALHDRTRVRPMIQIVRLQATEAVLDKRRTPERDFVFCDLPSYEDQNAPGATSLAYLFSSVQRQPSVSNCYTN
jgi:hypothetical protein